MIKILLCCLNEAQNLQTLLPRICDEMRLLNIDFEMMICLDGSSDNSREVISSFQKSHKVPITIIPEINQRGLGLAFKRLFIEAIKDSCDSDLLISLDADSTHDPKQMPEMISRFKANSLDFLVASRFCKNSAVYGFPLYRRIISKAISIVMQTIFPITKISGSKLKDYTSCYRIYSAKKMKELYRKEQNQFLTESGFCYSIEIAVKLSRIKARIDEIGILYDYGKKIGASKLPLLKDFWRLLVTVKKLKTSKIFFPF